MQAGHTEGPEKWDRAAPRIRQPLAPRVGVALAYCVGVTRDSGSCPESGDADASLDENSFGVRTFLLVPKRSQRFSEMPRDLAYVLRVLMAGEGNLANAA